MYIIFVLKVNIALQNIVDQVYMNVLMFNPILYTWFRDCSATAPVSYPAFIEEPPQ